MARSRIARDSALSQVDIIALLITEDPDIINEVDWAKWKSRGKKAAAVGLLGAAGVAGAVGFGGGETPGTSQDSTGKMGKQAITQQAQQADQGQQNDLEPGAVSWQHFGFMVKLPTGKTIEIPQGGAGGWAKARSTAAASGGTVQVIYAGAPDGAPISGNQFARDYLPHLIK